MASSFAQQLAVSVGPPKGFIELTPTGGELKVLIALQAICLIEHQNRTNSEAGARLTLTASQPRVPGLSLTLDVQETYDQVRSQLP